jgi:peptidoglycan/LPS O-acetylase OafA/YrhL
MQEVPKSNYYPGLDALRGVAVISVVCSHYFTQTVLFSWGWMGVDLFFVLSGFLISSILVRSKGGNHYLKNFYARRTLRIIPLSFALLSVFFISVAFFDKQDRFEFYKENWWYYFLFLQNWLFIFKGLPNEFYLNHFWSLAVEEQFYLFFPVAVYYFSKENLVKFIVASLPLILVVRIVIWYFNQEHLPAYYCNTVTRIDSILFGCLLGCGVRIKKTVFSIFGALFSILVLLAGVVYYRSASLTNPLMATVGYTLLALINYIFLSYFISNNKSFSFLRRSVVLNYIGKTSFGIYLFHIPVFLTFTSIYHKFFNSSSEIAIGLASFLITLVLSSISFYTLEKYFLRLKSNFPMNQPISGKEQSFYNHVAGNPNS